MVTLVDTKFSEIIGTMNLNARSLNLSEGVFSKPRIRVKLFILASRWNENSELLNAYTLCVNEIVLYPNICKKNPQKLSYLKR